ncbi:MAG: DUF58 domain-containing protein [Microscillaceae bacterium]|nr:DUF58 domain-containing protein [Microscillaceae bacterium]
MPSQSLYLSPRFFYILGGICFLFIISFSQNWLFPVTKIALFVLVGVFLLDGILLYATEEGIFAQRQLAEKLSNGDVNTITIEIQNRYPFKVHIGVIDEIPAQFQIRNFWVERWLLPQENHNLCYQLRPVERGEYVFGAVNVYVSANFGLVRRRYTFNQQHAVPVYPSYLQMRKYEFLAISDRLTEVGIKKVRRLGNSFEFEQIKEYVQGDDIRTINWRATARKNQLMVNHYQEEKSQQVYSLIDKGRVMQMPFEKLSLLDYAINATLVMSNIAMLKSDKAGLMSFSTQLDTFLPAQRGKPAMRQILEALYKEQTDFEETDFEHIYIAVKKHIKRRSLLMLYTNFETYSAMERQLKHLQGLAKQHVLVVVFFENTEISQLLQASPQSVEEIYQKAIAEKFVLEKKMIVKELRKFGIYSILTKPQNLTVEVINQYLALKARGVI